VSGRVSPGAAARPWIASVDDHVVEPPDLWATDAPAGVEVPRVERATWAAPGEAERPCDRWVFGDRRLPLTDVTAALGLPARQVGYRGLTYDQLHPACTDPTARLDALDRGATLASLCFPSFVGGAGEALAALPDRSAAAWCVRRYNDWLVERWCTPGGGRLLGVGLVPLWDADLAVAEVERNAERGVRAVSLPPDPTALGLPGPIGVDEGWDRFLATCAERGVVVCLHAQPPRGPHAPPTGLPLAVALSLLAAGVATALAELVFSGALSRHPDLRVLVVETEATWASALVRRMDRVWDVNRGWHGAELAERPGEVVARSVWFGLSDLGAPLVLDDVVRADRLLCEVDLPHTDSTWPGTPEDFAAATRHLVADDVDRIAFGNARELFGLDPADLARWSGGAIDAASARPGGGRRTPEEVAGGTVRR
jgi:predicted TIM-barrel fold metal-dependent hydrolase